MRASNCVSIVFFPRSFLGLLFKETNSCFTVKRNRKNSSKLKQQRIKFHLHKFICSYVGSLIRSTASNEEGLLSWLLHKKERLSEYLERNNLARHVTGG